MHSKNKVLDSVRGIIFQVQTFLSAIDELVAFSGGDGSSGLSSHLLSVVSLVRESARDSQISI